MISFTPERWSVVFPGVALPDGMEERYDAVLEFVEAWSANVGKLVENLLLKANRIRAVEADIAALEAG
jgi:hypothetical protein